MTKLRLAFMGTPDFSVPPLQALAQAGHDIVAVYCQPPRPAGRGQQIRKSPVHLTAEDMGIEVHTPKTLHDKDEQKKFTELNLDATVVVAYGLILPQAILSAPRYGCFNIHASLLPRWRGAAPIQRALLAGDTETGITIMQMDAGLDTGAIIIKDKTPITPKTTAMTLNDTLSDMGARLIVQAMVDLTAGKITPTPQPQEGVTYAAKLTREEGRVDWTKPAIDIERQIRAFTPWPGSFFTLGNEPIKILAAESVKDKTSTPGTLLDEQFTIACGQGALRLVTVQRSGKSPTDGASFLRGALLAVGSMVNTRPL